MDWRIERLTDENIGGVHAVWRGIIAERVFLATFAPPPLDKFQTFVKQARASGGVFMTALSDGEVIGYCNIERFGGEARRHGGGLATGVARNWRGRGLGSALMACALEAGFADGLERIELQVRIDNLPAQKLYRRFGFQTEGRLREALKVDGQPIDLLAMSLLKRDGAQAPAPS
jgi:RimJ/RimL family protein N-acetyltransferase